MNNFYGGLLISGFEPAGKRSVLSAVCTAAQHVRCGDFRSEQHFNLVAPPERWAYYNYAVSSDSLPANVRDAGFYASVSSTEGSDDSVKYSLRLADFYDASRKDKFPLRDSITSSVFAQDSSSMWSNSSIITDGPAASIILASSHQEINCWFFEIGGAHYFLWSSDAHFFDRVMEDTKSKADQKSELKIVGASLVVLPRHLVYRIRRWGKNDTTPNKSTTIRSESVCRLFSRYITPLRPK